MRDDGEQRRGLKERWEKKDGQKIFKWHRMAALRVWHTANPISFIATSSKSIKSISKEEIR